MKYLYPDFLKNIKNSHQIEKDSTVIIAFSGGKDSLTLLLLLKELQKDVGFKLLAAYFNHRIRADAEAEEQWVKNLCASKEVELEVGEGDVIEYKNKHKLNLENAASILRTRFLKKVASKRPNAKIATAHTKSDLTETFFIKLFRGSGSRGLSGIYSKVGEEMIRPLLIFTQKDILSFLERNNIQYYRDYTNKQQVFLRNRIRHVLMPEIEKIEPHIDDHVARTVYMIQEEYDYFKKLAQKILAENLIVNKILPVEVIKKNHPAVQRFVLREYIRRLKGDLLDIDFAHVENILSGISTSKGIAIPGLELKFHKGYIYPKSLTIPDYNYMVESACILEIGETGKKIMIEKETPCPGKPGTNFEALLPLSTVKFPLTIRSPRKGDRYIKLNSTLNLRVFEMIREAGFPAELRNLCPLVSNGDGRLIWSVGSPLADTFKVNPEDRQCLRIRCL